MMKYFKIIIKIPNFSVYNINIYKNKEECTMKFKFSPEECLHNPENIQKEYYLGTQTGDYICTGCGLTFAQKELFII